MRRRTSLSLPGLLLAFWFVLVGGEGAIVDPCPMHGNLAMLAGSHGASMHDAGMHDGSMHGASMHGASVHGAAAHQGDGHDGGHDHQGCGCGDRCPTGLALAVVPRAPELATGIVTVGAPSASRPVETGPRAPPAYATPFPTGPPRA